MEMIEQKAQNKEIADKPARAVRATNVVDLVKVLAGKPEPESIAQAETKRHRVQRQPFHRHAGQTEAARRRLRPRSRLASISNSCWPISGRSRFLRA